MTMMVLQMMSEEAPPTPLQNSMNQLGKQLSADSLLVIGLEEAGGRYLMGPLRPVGRTQYAPLPLGHPDLLTPPPPPHGSSAGGSPDPDTMAHLLGQVRANESAACGHVTRISPLIGQVPSSSLVKQQIRHSVLSRHHRATAATSPPSVPGPSAADTAAYRLAVTLGAAYIQSVQYNVVQVCDGPDVGHS